MAKIIELGYFKVTVTGQDTVIKNLMEYQFKTHKTVKEVITKRTDRMYKDVYRLASGNRPVTGLVRRGRGLAEKTAGRGVEMPDPKKFASGVIQVRSGKLRAGIKKATQFPRFFADTKKFNQINKQYKDIRNRKRSKDLKGQMREAMERESGLYTGAVGWDKKYAPENPSAYLTDKKNQGGGVGGFNINWPKRRRIKSLIINPIIRRKASKIKVRNEKPSTEPPEVYVPRVITGTDKLVGRNILRMVLVKDIESSTTLNALEKDLIKVFGGKDLKGTNLGKYPELSKYLGKAARDRYGLPDRERRRGGGATSGNLPKPKTKDPF